MLRSILLGTQGQGLLCCVPPGSAGVRDIPSLPIQNLRSHMEDTSLAQISRTHRTPLPVPKGTCGGHRILTVCVLLELGKFSRAERDPPAIAHLRVTSPKAGTTSHCVHCAGLDVAVPSHSVTSAP